MCGIILWLNYIDYIRPINNCIATAIVWCVQCLCLCLIWVTGVQWRPSAVQSDRQSTTSRHTLNGLQISIGYRCWMRGCWVCMHPERTMAAAYIKCVWISDTKRVQRTEEDRQTDERTNKRLAEKLSSLLIMTSYLRTNWVTYLLWNTELSSR